MDPAPPLEDPEMGVGIGTPSSTRQGGDEISNATVITELTQLTGTTAGAEYMTTMMKTVAVGRVLHLMSSIHLHLRKMWLLI